MSRPRILLYVTHKYERLMKLNPQRLHAGRTRKSVKIQSDLTGDSKNVTEMITSISRNGNE